jgi:Fe-S-cluster containining protein
VPVFGEDVWRLCRVQRLSPEQFVLIYPEKDPRPEAFQLEHGGQRYSLALDKKGKYALKKPCIFLVELPGGHARCGVYDQRPVVCTTYPMSLWSGVVTQRRETLCPPDSWGLAELSRSHWQVSLRRLCLQLDVFSEVVTRWNARVAVHPRHQFALPEFFSYLLNVYDRLDEVRQSLGQDAMAAVEATWPTFPRQRFDEPADFAAHQGAPWFDYYVRARQAIDSIYPHVPPQPPSLRPTTGDGDRLPENAGSASGAAPA